MCASNLPMVIPSKRACKNGRTPRKPLESEWVESQSEAIQFQQRRFL